MSNTLEEFKKERMKRFTTQKWHINDYYFNKEAFLEHIKNNTYIPCGNPRTIKQLKEYLKSSNGTVLLSKCDNNLIPLGRANDYADRDYLFYVNAKNALKNISLENSFFISYTGHSGAVGAVLASNKIPLTWNLILDKDAFGEKRNIEQIQDYYNELSTPYTPIDNTLALMLECPHGDFKTFDINKFPTLDNLKEKQIKDVYIFIEEPADTKVDFDEYNFYNDEFKNYLNTLKNGLNVHLVPIDEGTTLQNIVANKEKITNPEIYYSNFNCKKTQLKNI